MKKAIVLAAGEGKRMKSNTQKVLHNVLGVSMLKNIVDQLIESDFDKVIVIVGYGKDKVIKEIESFGDKVVYKEQPIGKDYPYGTGFALLQAYDEISEDDEVIVLYGNLPLLQKSTLDDFYKENIKQKAKASVMLKNSIKEDLDNSSSVYAFIGKNLKEGLEEIKNQEKANINISDVLDLLNQKGEAINHYYIKDESEIMAVNTRSQLLESEYILKNRINDKWLDQGVTIMDKSSTIIGPNVKIGYDTIIYPGVRIFGKTEIGEGCIIEGDTSITESKIGNFCHIKSTYITDSIVKDDVTIGPFAQLRPNTIVENGAHIGNFVELKKTVFGQGSKAGHLAYIGDAEVGKGVNIGCGVITVNYDGVNKHKTIINDHSFVGSNSNLVAPVKIGKNAFVAAGSTITKDVNEEDLAIERGEQVSIPGWVKRKNRVK